MVDGVTVHVNPADETELVRPTVPVNPLIGATVIVEATATPELVEMVVGLAEIEKSLPVMLTTTAIDGLVLIRVPDVALIVA